MLVPPTIEGWLYLAVLIDPYGEKALSHGVVATVRFAAHARHCLGVGDARTDNDEQAGMLGGGISRSAPGFSPFLDAWLHPAPAAKNVKANAPAASLRISGAEVDGTYWPTLLEEQRLKEEQQRREAEVRPAILAGAPCPTYPFQLEILYIDFKQLGVPGAVA